MATQLEELESKIYLEAETKLKTLLGDLWQEHKDEMSHWAQMLAQLEFDIATGNHPCANQITYDHLTKIGIPCFVQRIRGKVESQVVNLIASLLQMLLDCAVAVGTSYLDKKISKLV